MFELTESSAAQYLATRGFEPDRIRVTPLGGGVSNTVLLVEPAAGPRIVLKQSLEKLRVQADWRADRDRIVREYQSIQLAAQLLPPGSVPSIVFADPVNCIYAMSAAGPESRPWKEWLFAGRQSQPIARRAAELLARLVTGTWKSPEFQAQYGDKRVFDQLRLDAYYRFTAARHADLAPRILALVERTLASNLSLVHGDWSPKNLLVPPSSADVMAIDFEVVHFGDPAFDLAFLVNHLLLKSAHLRPNGTHCLAAARTFWAAFRDAVPADIAAELEPRAIAHLGALLLARIDGKSPAEYLRDADKPLLRRTARAWIADPPADLETLFGFWETEIALAHN